MLNELTGLLDYSKVREYKNFVSAMDSFALNQHKVNGIDTYVGHQQDEDLRRFCRTQELEDVKKLLNKPTGEDFSAFFKRACDNLKKR